MDRKAQSALEYLMTYGWALVVIAIIIGALVLLLGQSTTAQTCTMSPAAGAIGYKDHQVTGTNIIAKFRNDSGAVITDVNYTFSGDFTGSAINQIASRFQSAADVNLDSVSVGTSAGSTYNGVVTIKYMRSGIQHTATATCTGKAA